VRVVLGHFMFVYIHPYMDGNGRLGGFLMNVMMASSGYPWTVVPVADRKIYMEALEKASAREDIVPFTNFLAGLVKRGSPQHCCLPCRRLRSDQSDVGAWCVLCGLHGRKPVPSPDPLLCLLE